MITFGQLRSAILNPEPRAGLDALVRAELAAGKNTKAIYDELLGHIDLVRAMQEYTDTLEDALGDTLDALSGWCHPDFCYKDPPNSALTTPATPPGTIPEAAPPTSTSKPV
jgi:hypothetical protein